MKFEIVEEKGNKLSIEYDKIFEEVDVKKYIKNESG